MSETSLLLPNYEIFVKPDLYDITNRQYEEQKELANFVQWARRNPVLAAEELLGIEFLDYQKYVFMMSWNTPNVVWCMCRNAGKSILGAIFIMMKTLLIPNHKTYILCGVGSQSIEMFTKIEKLTNNEIPSFKSLTDVFRGEIVKSNGNSKGFVHNPASYRFATYSDSEVFTLNGAYDNNRSKRSNLNFYDECMNSPDELFTTSEPFTTQNSKFGLGVDYDETDQLAEPEPFYNQLLYASSAGRTDGYFYKKYRECSLRMDAGDRNYFCASVDCNVVLKATKRGVGLPESLLTQDKIDSAMRKDKEAAMREYKNIFTTEGSDQQIIRRADITRNSFPYIPELKYVPGCFYAIAYDPARRADNSTIAVARFWEDPAVGWKMRMVNCVVLLDRMTNKKRMMNTPNQVEELKQIILDYNGEGMADYENLLAINVDAGSGGAGVNITDFIADDWTLRDGVVHRGLVDPEYNEGDEVKFPNAVRNILHLISPSKFRSDMFEEAIEMVSQNVVEFPEEYNGRGYVDLIYEIDEKGKAKQRYSYPTEKEMTQLEKKGIQIETRRHNLDQDEEEALVQIEAMKTEIVNMYRFKSATGKDRFELAPDKVSYMHDDRNYCFILLCHILSQLRRKSITDRKRADTSDDFVAKLPIRKGVRSYTIG